MGVKGLGLDCVSPLWSSLVVGENSPFPITPALNQGRVGEGEGGEGGHAPCSTMCDEGGGTPYYG